MTTTTEDSFHEIQLNGKQLVFLFMAVVVMAVVIFLCGVLVGRGVRGASIEALSTPAATGTAADAAIPATPPSAAPPTAHEDLSYPKRLAGGEPTPEKLRGANTQPAPQVAPPAPTPAAPAPAASAAAAGSNEPAGAGFAIQITALSRRADADAMARGLTTKGYPAYVMNPDAGAPAVFRVRVGKFKDRREAESVAARLEKEEQLKPWIVR